MDRFTEEFRKHDLFFKKMAHIWGRAYGIPFDDALITCQEAFYDAYQRWSPDKKASLTTFTSYYIMGRMASLHKKEFKHMGEEVEIIENTVSYEDTALDEIHEDNIHNKLLHAINTYLSDKEAYCVKLYFWRKDQSVRTIGDKLGLTPQRVSQILHKALDKLKMVLNAEDFYA